jgi:lipopolysaccharide export system protein LptA
MKSEIQRRYKLLKWIPPLLLLAIVGFATYVWLEYSGEKEKIEIAKAKSTMQNIRRPGGAEPLNLTHKMDYTQFDNGRKVYHVTADGTQMLPNNQQQLENPEFVFFDEKEQEQIRIKGKHCNVSPNFDSITVFDGKENKQPTLVTSPNGMSIKTHQIEYKSGDRQFSTTTMALFEWDTLKGKSKGFTYKIETDKLLLPENPEIHFVNTSSDDQTPIVMTGDHGMIDRKNGFAFFEGNVDVTQGKDKIRAHRIEVIFKPKGHDLEKITAVKDVHIRFPRPGNTFETPNPDAGSDAKPAASAPAAQTAATAAGSPQSIPSMANVFQADASSGKDLDAQLVELFFYDNGRTIKTFHSIGDCTFVLHAYGPNNKPTENRIIKGETFDALFNEQGDMKQFHANDNVSVKLQPIGNPKKQQEADQQTIFCKDMVADFIEKTGDVKEIHFNDSFRHVQGGRTVSSDRAVYSGATKTTDLIGEPEIIDSTFNIKSTSMQLSEDTSNVHAQGDVKSSFIQGEGKNSATFPFSSPSKQPVYISSEIMDWDSQKAEATYTEKAKLWQEKNVITAAKLVINNRDNTLAAYEKVHTIFYNKNVGQTQTSKAQTQTAKTQSQPQSQAQSQPSLPAPKEVKIFSDSDTDTNNGPITVDAGAMNYADKDRIIHFEKDVKIVTTSTKINSDRADFYLNEQTQDFDRLYAMGKVTINHDRKTGKGTLATFYNDGKRLVLEGNPKLSEPGQADIYGRVLTLFLNEDRILIDGQEDGRANSTLSVTGQSVISNDNSSSNNQDDKKPTPP